MSILVQRSAARALIEGQAQREQESQMREAITATERARDDRRWLARQPLYVRLTVRAARRTVNYFAQSAIVLAHERSLITADTMHELCGIVNRRLWPERH